MKNLFLRNSLLFLWGLLSCNPNPQKNFDVVILGGMVNTGEGHKSFQADIGIEGDTIAYVGDPGQIAGRHTIDARGKMIVPGFIDMHLHLEEVFEFPELRNVVSQGITLGLGGPDERGFWPFSTYLDSLSRVPLTANVAFLMGHNKIRQSVMGMEDRSPDPDELEAMKHMVRQAMQEGAFGLSTGLKYLPGVFSTVDEIIELAAMAARYEGIYTSHLREEGLGLIEGVEEAIKIGHRAGIPVVLTHHKVIGQPMWGASKRTLAMVDS